MITTDIDTFLRDGCGRCELFATPRCKVRPWVDGLQALRELLLAAGLTETMKWGSPCYTLDGGIVAMLAALRESFALGFPKGVLLADPDGLLERPGPNTQADRLLRFHATDEVAARRDAIQRFIDDAIRVQRSGERFERSEAPEPMPAELQALLDGDPALQAAFDALTPGRRRSHVLHVSGAKQSSTRAARAEKCAEKIRSGKGFLDR